MKFGICIPNYGETFSVESLKEISITAECLGYESLWATDHVVMPNNSGTPYDRILESMCTLAYLAGVTNRIRIGISSLIIAMRNPLLTAKQLASVDILSQGRLIVAIGVGWNAKEFSFLGSDFHTRGKRVDESINILRRLWSGGTQNLESSVTGVRVEDAVFEPKPISKHLDIWIGGTSRKAMKRAATLGDAWHPNVFPLSVFEKMVKEFRQISPSAREKPICVRIGLNTSASQAEYLGPQGDRRIMFSGNMDENKQIIRDLESIGVNYALLTTNPDGRVPPSHQIESLNQFAGEFL
jgi:probable F420-dependent oxidoreductase